jgi:hypothetical protein
MTHIVRERNLNPICRYQISFVWLLLMNKSDDGLIEEMKLITLRFVNFVVHDGGLNMYIFIHTHTHLIHGMQNAKI